MTRADAGVHRARLTTPRAPALLALVPWLRLAAVLALRSLADPRLGAALLRVAWRFRRRRWWRRPPFLPLPSVAYVRWRLSTAYGDAARVPSADDVARYARWAAG